MDIRIINFPDPNFKEYLIQHFDKDGDGEISLTEALTITRIYCSGKKIHSVRGIEFMENLISLDVSDNSIEEVDLQQNIKLEILCCDNNNLKVFDITKNINLHYINCKQNHQLSSLDTTKCIILKTLYCGSCCISHLDISNNHLLETLSCYFNPIREIYLSKNPQLKSIRVRNCCLSSIDTTANRELHFLDCSENNLYCIDLSHNLKIKKLYCNRNPLLKHVIVTKEHVIEEVHSPIPLSFITKDYDVQSDSDYLHQERTYNDYNGSYAQEVMGYSDQDISDAFDGDADAYWNID